MPFNTSIRNRLVAIIMLVTTLTGIIGYSAFVYWFLDNQHKNIVKTSESLGLVLGQDIAKLILLNDVSAASDITTKLKSFKNLQTTVLYKLDKKPILQYSKDNKSFKVKPLDKKIDKIETNGNLLKIYTKAIYQDTNLGFVQLNFKIMTLMDVIKKDIANLFLIFIFMIFVSFLLASYFAKRFTEPIYKLVSFLESLDFNKSVNERVITSEKNEFKKLYEEVNHMLQRLEDYYNDLKIAAVTFESEAGITITNKKQEIIKVNKTFTKITGFKEEEVIGKTPKILNSGVHGKEFYDDMFNSLREKKSWMGEITNKHKEGNLVNEHLTIQAVLDDSGEIIYFVASFLDITVQKEMENKLREKEKQLFQKSKMAAMGEMLENIAHQWRQPLSIISSLSTSLSLNKELGLPSDDKSEIENLEKINTTAQYLSSTIDDFRSFFKQDKEKEAVGIKNLVESALKLINDKLKSKNIKLIAEFEDKECFILKNEFIQVLINIINNARDELEKQTLKEKLIHLHLEEDEENLILSIKDNAGGIPEDIINRIFEPYFTTKEDSKGTGIGLYMSLEMIESHMNGTIKVENKEFSHENKTYFGAEFKIIVPKA